MVIGRDCRHVPKERAHEVIAGYTIVNDVTIRDWQMRVPTMTMGKSWDTHCPMGPWIVTADELLDPHALDLKTFVNGELRQSSNTKNLIFNCFDLVEHLSTAFTLEVGDVIQVEVLRLDADRSRIALSRKKLLPNPWESIEERYRQGETVLVIITRVVDFGAFAQLEPGVEGLIHVSEVAEIEVAEPLKSIVTGDRVAVKILRVDPERQRIGLSRRQADDMAGQALLEAEADHITEQAEDSAGEEAMAPNAVAMDTSSEEAQEESGGEM